MWRICLWYSEKSIFFSSINLKRINEMKTIWSINIWNERALEVQPEEEERKWLHTMKAWKWGKYLCNRRSWREAFLFTFSISLEPELTFLLFWEVHSDEREKFWETPDWEMTLRERNCAWLRLHSALFQWERSWRRLTFWRERREVERNISQREILTFCLLSVIYQSASAREALKRNDPDSYREMKREAWNEEKMYLYCCVSWEKNV